MRQKSVRKFFCDKKVCVNRFCIKTSVLKSFLQQKSVRWLYLRQKSVHKSFSRRKKYIELQFDVQIKIICAVFVTSSPFYGDITILHAAPKSVKRVKSSAQILDMMHRWWLNTMSKMESSDDRSFLQVHLWHSTARKMTYPLFYLETFQAFRKLSRLSGNYFDYSKSFKTIFNYFGWWDNFTRVFQCLENV